MSVIDHEDPQHVTYKDVEKLLYSLVNWFKIYKTPLFDEDDLQSAAHAGFIQAYNTYDPDKGSFEKWVVSNVFQHLRNLIRVIRLPKNRYFKRDVDFDVEGIECWDLEPFNPIDFCRERDMTFEATEVIKIVFDPPLEIQLSLAQLDKQDNELTKVDWKDAIADYLIDVGWHPRKVSKVFAEIGRKLYIKRREHGSDSN